MSAILGLAKTLRRLEPDVARRASRRDAAAMIEDQAERHSQSVAEELLDLAALPLTARRSLRLRRVSVSRSRRPLGPRAVELEGRQPRRADRGRLRARESTLTGSTQVCSKLLVQRGPPRPGTATLRGFADGPRYVFHISDEGQGVEPEYAEEIFLPFSRRSERTDSTGLGLAIARAIVEAHGGTLVYLPRGRAASATSSSSRCRRTARAGAGWSSEAVEGSGRG